MAISFSYRGVAAATGALLLAAEAVVAVLALWCAHVPQSYTDYYIKHTRQCWLPQGAEPEVLQELSAPTVGVDRLTSNAACYVFIKGWAPGPPWGRTPWFMGQGDQASWLDLPRPPGAKVLVITLAGTSPLNPQTVQMSADDHRQALLTLPPNAVPVDLRLPLTPEANAIRVRFDKLQETDGYPMAILQFKWIRG
jgi:hypothetical protein